MVAAAPDVPGFRGSKVSAATTQHILLPRNQGFHLRPPTLAQRHAAKPLSQKHILLIYIIFFKELQNLILLFHPKPRRHGPGIFSSFHSNPLCTRQVGNLFLAPAQGPRSLETAHTDAELRLQGLHSGDSPAFLFALPLEIQKAF